MNSHPITVLSICAVMAASLAGQAQEPPSTDDTLRHFHHAVDAYAQLHRRLEHRVAPLRAESSPREIVASSDALAAALQAARVDAHEGDIFGPRAADSFRALISRALQLHGFTVENVVTASGEEAPPDAALPVVNERFPWARGAAVFPCVLLALPPLPEELQYRIVGRDLVLVDVHATLVVDILRDALR